MPPDNQDSTSGDDIVNAARSQLGSLTYKKYGYSNGTPAGVPKDDHFVADTLDTTGLGFGDRRSDRPSAADWADPSSAIPGWRPVTDGSIRAGDVLATTKPIPRNWYEGGGQQLGIATGNGASVGIVDNNRVSESDWGFKDGHNPTVWRSTQLADMAAPLRDDDAPIAAPRDPVIKEDLPPPEGQEGCPISNKGECPWGGKGRGLPNPNDRMQTIPDSVPGDRNMPNFALPPWKLDFPRPKKHTTEV